MMPGEGDDEKASGDESAQHRAQRLFGPHQLPPEPHQREELKVGDEPADDRALIDGPEDGQRRPGHERQSWWRHRWAPTCDDRDGEAISDRVPARA